MPQKSLTDEVNWRVMQAYANAALKYGVQKYMVKEIEEGRERSRKFRAWLKHHKAMKGNER